MSKIEIDRAVMQQTLDALVYAHATNRYESARQDRAIKDLRKALAASQSAKCWKCGDTDPAFQAVCDVPACEMREALAAANSPESEGIKTVVQQEPVLFIHPDTFAKASAHVGAWKPGHELPGYIPLYTAPHPTQQEPVAQAWLWQFDDGDWHDQPFATIDDCENECAGYDGKAHPLYTSPQPPAHQQEPDALHMVIMDLARKQSDRIAELESTAAEFKSVGWAISYDGQTPYRMWYEGDGDMLDLEVRRLGGTACKIELFTKVKK